VCVCVCVCVRRVLDIKWDAEHTDKLQERRDVGNESTLSVVPCTAEKGQQLVVSERASSANVHATQSGSAMHLEQQLAASGAVVPIGYFVTRVG
jgi:hypothetical protein